jgi:protein tyrosine phosphatase (PTP) superfamily phosphohydrolase (DUF442 family)
MRKSIVSLLFFGTLIGCQSRTPTSPPNATTSATAEGKEAIPLDGLHNVFKISEKLYSGSSPEGDEGFRSLQHLGVRTIISVDGARPDVEKARGLGMRYVHLPIGYDGVPRDQALRIAKAVRDLPGPIYIHCHHGQHRGPAAAATAQFCLDERCGIDEALAVMRRAGTDPHYTGLYAAPKEIQRPTAAELDSIPSEFPEVAKVSSLATLMVNIDERFDHLKTIRASDWRVPVNHADLDPPHEALQLLEQFREAGRLPIVPAPDEMQTLFRDAERIAAELETALREKNRPAVEPIFKRLQATCQKCHDRFRDKPATR